TAKQIIAEAYQLTEYQIAGGPGWIGSDRFALQAKTEARTGRDEICLILRVLLSERFQFLSSRESREMRVYALTRGRGGPDPARFQVKAAAESPSSTGFHKADATFEGHTGGRAATFPGTTMELFARSLSELRAAQPGTPLL